MSGEVTEILEDFSGGMNSFISPNRLILSKSTINTNVWYENGALKKRNGISSFNTSPSDSAHSFRPYTYKMDSTNFGNTSYSASNVSGQNLAIILSSGSSVPSNFVISDDLGTASTTSGSTTVTGSGTSWLNTNRVRSGAAFRINSDGSIRRISTVVSNTELTLESSYPSTNTNVAYKIIPAWNNSTRISLYGMNGETWITGPFNSSTNTGTPISVVSNSAIFRPNFPSANYSITFRNYMFAANIASSSETSRNRIRWSSLKDPATWPASNFVDVNPDDGNPICGLFSDGQSIIILKTISMWKLTGDVFDPTNPTYSLSQIYTPDDFLTNSSKSVRLFNGKYLILGLKGFYSYEGGNEIHKVTESDQLISEWSQIQGFSPAVIPSVEQEPASAIVNGKYWISVESNSFTHTPGFKNVVFVIDQNGSFWRHNYNSSVAPIDMDYFIGDLIAVNNESTGGATGGNFILNSSSGFSDNVNSINGTWTSKVFEFPKIQMFMRAYIHLKKQPAGNLTFEFSIDEGAFVSNTIDMTSGTGTRIKSNIITIGRIGKSIQFRLSNNVDAQDFEIYAIEYLHRPLKQ